MLSTRPFCSGMYGTDILWWTSDYELRLNCFIWWFTWIIILPNVRPKTLDFFTYLVLSKDLQLDLEVLYTGYTLHRISHVVNKSTPSYCWDSTKSLQWAIPPSRFIQNMWHNLKGQRWKTFSALLVGLHQLLHTSHWIRVQPQQLHSSDWLPCTLPSWMFRCNSFDKPTYRPQIYSHVRARTRS